MSMSPSSWCWNKLSLAWASKWRLHPDCFTSSSRPALRRGDVLVTLLQVTGCPSRPCRPHFSRLRNFSSVLPRSSRQPSRLLSLLLAGNSVFLVDAARSVEKHSLSSLTLEMCLLLLLAHLTVLPGWFLLAGPHDLWSLFCPSEFLQSLSMCSPCSPFLL